MKKDPALHLGHFERIRTQVMQTDVHKLTPELVFEMMLQVLMRRGDANEISRRIMKVYGDFNKFCRLVSYEGLIKINGIGDVLAKNLLCLTKIILYSRFNLGDSVEGKYASVRTLVSFLEKVYKDAKKEMLIMFILNDRNEVLRYVVLGQGSFSAVEVDVTELKDAIYLHGGRKIILSHNHPEGTFYPSAEDVEATSRLYAFCRSYELELVDHIVMNRYGYLSFKDSGILEDIRHKLIEKAKGRRIFPD